MKVEHVKRKNGKEKEGQERSRRKELKEAEQGGVRYQRGE
jgi:hypothetical protein